MIIASGKSSWIKQKCPAHFHSPHQAHEIELSLSIELQSDKGHTWNLSTKAKKKKKNIFAKVRTA